MSPMKKSSIKKLSKIQACSLNPHTIPTKYPIILTFMVNIKLIKHDKVKFQSFQEEMNNTMEMQRFGGRKDENNSLKYLTLPFGINLLRMLLYIDEFEDLDS